MLRWLLLLVALAVASALSSLDPSTIPDHFKPSATYKYVFDSQVSTGIPRATAERSGTRTSCVVTLEPMRSGRITMKLSNYKEARYNAPDPRPEMIKPMDWYERSDISTEEMEHLKLPVEFSYSAGKIEDIMFERTDVPSSANVKRGILSMLQVNMASSQKSEAGEQSNLMNMLEPRKKIDQPTSFRSLESTVEGECEVFYTVIPEKWRSERTTRSTKVTKTINFERCRRRPQIRYNFRFADRCPTSESKYNDDEKSVKSSTIVSYNLAGSPERFLIKNATATSKYTFIPYDETNNVIETVVMINLKLADVEDSQRNPEKIRQPVRSSSGLIYSTEADKKQEKFSMNYNEPKPTSDSEPRWENRVEKTGTLMRKLLANMNRKIDEMSTRTFVKLIDVLRKSTPSEIEQIHDRYFRSDESSFTSEEKTQARDILPHAMAQCGTIKCVKHLVKKTCNGEIPARKATLAVMSMINNRMVSREIIDELTELSRCDPGRRDPNLKRTLMLTIGSMMNAVCSDSDDRLAIDEESSTDKRCTHQDKQRYVEKIVTKVKNAEGWEDQVLQLKALANAGIDISIFELEKLIKDPELRSPVIRAEAIMAMRKIKDMMPKKIQNILMPIAADRLENPIVRMAAINMIIDSLPKKNVLEQLIRIMKTDSSRQIVSYIKSSMMSIKDSEQPCTRQMKTDVDELLRIFNIRELPSASFSTEVPFHSDNLKAGIGLKLSSIQDGRSTLPNLWKAGISSNYAGLWNKLLVAVGLSSEGIEPANRRDRDSETHPRYTDDRKYDSELKQIIDTLNIRSRSPDRSAKPKSYLSVQLKGQNVLVQPLESDQLSDIFREGVVSSIDNSLKIRSPRGVSINANEATMLDEMEHRIPTIMGTQLRYKSKAPLVVSINGHIASSNGDSERTKQNIEIDIEPSICATWTTSVESQMPSAITGYKLERIVKINTPIKSKIQMSKDRSSDKTEISISLKTPGENRHDFLKLESRPVLFTRSKRESDALERTLLLPVTSDNDDDYDELDMRSSGSRKSYERQMRHRDYYDERRSSDKRMSSSRSPMSFEKCFGDDKIGVQICTRGIVSPMPQKSIKDYVSYMTPLAKPNKIVMSVERGDDCPDEIKIKFSKQKASPDSRELRHNHMRSQRNIYSDEPHRSSEDEPSSSTQISAEIVSSRRRHSMTVKLTSDPMEKKQKFSARLYMDSTRNNPEPKMVCIDGEMKSTPHPELQTDDEYVSDKPWRQTLNTEIWWGRDCNSDNFISIKGVEKRSHITSWSRSQLDKCSRSRSSDCSPLTISELINSEPALTAYKLDVEFSNVDATVKKLALKALRMIQNEYFWNSQSNELSVNNPPNKVSVDIATDGKTPESCDINIKMPSENIKLYNIPVPSMLKKPSGSASDFSSISRDFIKGTEPRYEQKCHVSDRKVRTFSDAEYQVPMTDCLTVLSKDCSRKPRYAVLMRRASPTSDIKEIKIITRNHKVQLLPTSENPETISVVLDDEAYRPFNKRFLTNDDNTIEIRRHRSVIEVELKKIGINVQFDGYAVDIKVDNDFRDTQCGLCGRLDSDRDDELMNADNSPASDIRHFYRSYILKTDRCTVPDTSTLCSDRRCRPSPRWSSRDDDNRRRYDDRSSDRHSSRNELDSSDNEFPPTPEYAVIDHDNELCISKIPIPQCPSHSYPVMGRRSERQVDYTCVDRDDRLIFQLLDKSSSREERKRKLHNRPVSFSRTQAVPIRCADF